MEILLCVDGSDYSLQCADLITKLGFPSASKIIALGVSEKKEDVERLTNAMDLLDSKFGGKFSITRKIRSGKPSEEILTETLEYSYDLVVLGGGGQLGVLHPTLGPTTSKLVRKLHTHFLVARNIPERIGKILVCAGAEAAPSETMALGGAWISGVDAQISLLHVVRPPQTGADVSQPIRVLSTKDKEREERLLERASLQLREAGVKNKITPLIRRGLVVDEVLHELSQDSFELMVIGAHYQPGQDRWQVALFDDVTDQLLNRASCSVLII